MSIFFPCDLAEIVEDLLAKALLDSRVLELRHVVAVAIAWARRFVPRNHRCLAEPADGQSTTVTVLCTSTCRLLSDPVPQSVTALHPSFPDLTTMFRDRLTDLAYITVQRASYAHAEVLAHWFPTLAARRIDGAKWQRLAVLHPEEMSLLVCAAADPDNDVLATAFVDLGNTELRAIVERNCTRYIVVTRQTAGSKTTLQKRFLLEKLRLYSRSGNFDPDEYSFDPDEYSLWSAIARLWLYHLWNYVENTSGGRPTVARRVFFTVPAENRRGAAHEFSHDICSMVKSRADTWDAAARSGAQSRQLRRPQRGSHDDDEELDLAIEKAPTAFRCTGDEAVATAATFIRHARSNGLDSPLPKYVLCLDYGEGTSDGALIEQRIDPENNEVVIHTLMSFTLRSAANVEIGSGVEIPADTCFSGAEIALRVFDGDYNAKRVAMQGDFASLSKPMREFVLLSHFPYLLLALKRVAAPGAQQVRAPTRSDWSDVGAWRSVGNVAPVEAMAICLSGRGAANSLIDLFHELGFSVRTTDDLDSSAFSGFKFRDPDSDGFVDLDPATHADAIRQLPVVLGMYNLVMRNGLVLNDASHAEVERGQVDNNITLKATVRRSWATSRIPEQWAITLELP